MRENPYGPLLARNIHLENETMESLNETPVQEIDPSYVVLWDDAAYEYATNLDDVKSMINDALRGATFKMEV